MSPPPEIRITKRQIMRSIRVSLILFYCIQINFAEASFFNISLSEYWKFSTGDSIKWADPFYDDTNWNVISSQYYWEEQGYKDYNGYGWYRQVFAIPQEKKQAVEMAGGLYIKYDYADDVDEVYINGHWIGRMGEFPPNMKVDYENVRKFKISSAFLFFDQPNVIAIRVYDNGGGGGLKTTDVVLSQISPMDDISLKPVFEKEDWTFTDTDTISFYITMTDALQKSMAFNLVCLITTDDYFSVDSLCYAVSCPAKENIKQKIMIIPPSPGFYRITAYTEQNGAKSDRLKFNVGYKPEQISSPVDSQPDFDVFWKNTLHELQQIAPQYKMTLLPEKSGDAKDVYHIEMYSLNNVKIEGYYSVPKKEGKHPAIISFLGYGAISSPPNPTNLPGFCEFVLSTRGQGIQKNENAYGDWVIHGLESKETYYYRGAFMDAVRGIDFLCSRPEVDKTKIFAEGGSQGGAFTLAACALDNRICGAAPYMPFLSDFPDYFKIAPWPKSVFEPFLNEHTMYDRKHVYKVLSYFDMKNLTPRITCPIIMGVGLQDNICPPHINFSGYNHISSPKRYYIYPDQKHTVGKTWWGIRDQFFRELCK